MKPVEFKEMTCVYAKDQPEYISLPVHKSKDGTLTSCWKLTLYERLQILFTGRVWCSVLTFNTPLQPQKFTIKKPSFKEGKK